MLNEIYYNYDVRFVLLADDKVRDRLAQIAREKLGILSKEKQLQIERKKRAMAFLNNIKGKSFTEQNRLHFILIYIPCFSLYRAPSGCNAHPRATRSRWRYHSIERNSWHTGRSDIWCAFNSRVQQQQQRFGDIHQHHTRDISAEESSTCQRQWRWWR